MNFSPASQTELDVKSRLVSDHLWHTAVNFVHDSDYPHNTYFATFFWVSLLYSVKDILSANRATDAVIEKFPSTIAQFLDPGQDRSAVSPYIDFRNLVYKALFSSGIDPTSERGMIDVLTLASMIGESEDAPDPEPPDPQLLTDYMLAVLDVTKFATALFSVADSVNNSVVRTDVQKTTSSNESRRSFPWGFIFIAAFLIWFIVTIVMALHEGISTAPSGASADSPTESTRTSETRESLYIPETYETYETIRMPAPTPYNGYIFEYPKDEMVAPLKLITPGSGGYYFVLVPTSDAGNEMKFYVHAGTTIEILVPVGHYEIYYACGDTWYGESDLFGDETVYQKCDEEFWFSMDSQGYNGWTLELQPVSYGNLDTTYVNADDFPN